MEKPDVTWRVFCMYMLILILIMWAGIANAQIQITQFNASWNSANEVLWVGKLTDCKTISYIDISMQSNTNKYIPNILQVISGFFILFYS